MIYSLVLVLIFALAWQRIPRQVRQDEVRPWQQAKVHFGGQWREVRYKEVSGVRWRRGAGPRPLRLLVVAPLPYRVSPHARLNYRQPAYLLTTDLASGAACLLQAYLDRWQIELNHRDQKSLLGVGQAQVHSALSVPRQPALVVASYSLLLLAALQAFGPGRTSDYLPLPKWRKPAGRPSLLDILNLLRHQINETSVSCFPRRDFRRNSYALRLYLTPKCPNSRALSPRVPKGEGKQAQKQPSPRGRGWSP